MTDVQWVHVLALMGDASDNVPGVSGIGAKGALSLIQEYGSVEGVLENAEKVRHMGIYWSLCQLTDKTLCHNISPTAWTRSSPACARWPYANR